jgi:hypothetical protein
MPMASLSPACPQMFIFGNEEFHKWGATLTKEREINQTKAERLVRFERAALPLGQRLVNRLLSEATMGFEPMMRVLQTLALPLGDVAAKQIIRDST